MQVSGWEIVSRLKSLTVKASHRVAGFLEYEVVGARLKTSSYTISKLVVIASASTLTAAATTILILLPPLPITLLLLSLAISPPILSKIALRIYLNGRAASIDRELRLFKVYASMLASGGLHLYEVFKKIIGYGMFPSLEAEAKAAVRNVEVLGMDPRSGLEEMAKTSPSRRLRELVYNYTALELSGGDTSRYLEEEARDSLKSIEYDASLYSERVSVYSEIMVGMLLMFSMLTSVGAALSPTLTTDLLILQVAVVIPFTTALIWVVADATQPKVGISYTPSWKLLVLGAAASLAVLVTVGPSTVAVSAAVSTFLLCLGMGYLRVKRVGEESEKALTTLLREIVEYRKLGYTPMQALERIVGGTLRLGALSQTLRDVIIKVRAGIRPSQMRVESPSWLVRAVFKMLGDVEDSGGGNPAVLEALYRMVESLRTVKRRISVNVRLYEAIAYATPIILSISSGLTIGLCNVLGQTISHVSLGVSMYYDTGSLRAQLELLIIVSSLSMGLLSVKVSEYTVKGTFKAGIVMSIATLSILFLGRIANIVAGMMV